MLYDSLIDYLVNCLAILKYVNCSLHFTSTCFLFKKHLIVFTESPNFPRALWKLEGRIIGLILILYQQSFSFQALASSSLNCSCTGTRFCVHCWNCCCVMEQDDKNYLKRQKKKIHTWGPNFALSDSVEPQGIPYLFIKRKWFNQLLSLTFFQFSHSHT